MDGGWLIDLLNVGNPDQAKNDPNWQDNPKNHAPVDELINQAAISWS